MDRDSSEDGTLDHATNRTKGYLCIFVFFIFLTNQLGSIKNSAKSLWLDGAGDACSALLVFCRVSKPNIKSAY
jgi:hypothetical protein